MLKVLRCKKISVACEKFQSEIHGRKIYKHLPAKRGNPLRLHLFGCSTPISQRADFPTESKNEQKNMKGSRRLNLVEMMLLKKFARKGCQKSKMAKDSPCYSIFGDRGAWLQKTRGFYFRYGRGAVGGLSTVGSSLTCTTRSGCLWTWTGVVNIRRGAQFRTVGPSVDLHYPV